MTLQILSASSQSDREQWLKRWEAWPVREVSAHPDYVTLFAEADEDVICLAWESDDFSVLFPLIVRPIASQAWAKGIEGVDLVSPYGYGGPFSWGSKGSMHCEFWRAFDDWAKESKVVTAFARLSLFPDALLSLGRGDVVVTQLNVVRNLDLSPEELLRDYEHKVRKNIKRALTSGVQVQFDMDCSRLDEFLAIYESTMDRRSADSRYYFDEAFFKRLCEDLTGQYCFAYACVAGTVVSTELVLLSESHAYSFLGGTLSEFFHLRPNDLLKHEIACWAQHSGMTEYVLGGGYGGQDGIFRYKRSFAPNGVRDFSVWRYVIDQAKYNQLNSVRQHYDLSLGTSTVPGADYFPAYRGSPSKGGS